MIYVHVPFCRSFCTYCGFYSELAGKDCETVSRAYVEVLCKEIEARKDEIASSGHNTLYIGGGTPSVLPLDAFSDIVRCLHPQGQWDEFTVEVNPDDIVRKGRGYAAGLRSLGVNRISMGVQSFDDGLLHWMNRRHSAQEAEEAFRLLREAGFDNISIDLIFGIGDFNGREFTEAMWEDSISRALALKPEHISAYQLSVEPDSALEKLVERGRFSQADDEKCARQYDCLCRRLREAGYHHYEISNFALPGREAKHNSAYWRHVPYVGLGPGAHSLRNDGKWLRSWNCDSLKNYLEATEKGFQAICDGEELSEEQMHLEDIMLGLRTDSGISPDILSKAEKATAERLLANGDLVLADGRIRIPEERFFVSDSIISELA